ncbi:MAG: hypothetical protein LZF62_140022 [Nitrospira sp.]|nr:MAG: hypothetical protein LZF62_140022 [Nitrospira sp.]
MNLDLPQTGFADSSCVRINAGEVLSDSSLVRMVEWKDYADLSIRSLHAIDPLNTCSPL